MHFNWTLKRMLATSCCILAAMIVFLAIQLAWQAYQVRQNAELAQHLSPAINSLLEAAGHWAVERGVTNAALNAATKIDDELHSVIQERRKAGNTAYQNAMEVLGEFDDPDIKALRQELQTRYQAANALREQADEDMEKSAFLRKTTLLKNWVPTMSAMIITSQNLRFELGQLFSTTDTELSTQSQMKHFSWMMSEYAGRERAIIGGLITSKNFIIDKKLKQLAIFRGHVASAWDIVQKLYSETRSADTRDAIDQVREVYFTEFETLRERVYQAGINGEPYPLTTKEWVAASSAIDSILAIQTASMTETEAFIAQMQSSSLRQFLFALIMLAAGIVISLASIWVILRKVIAPLNEMSGAMNELAGGNTSVEIPSLGEQNEIGLMASSVQVFKDNAIEQQKLQQQKEEAEQQAREEKKKAMRELADSFEQRVQGIIETVSSAALQLSKTSEAMTETIRDSSHTAQEAAASATQTTANVQSVASSVEEMSATVKEISNQIHHSNSLVTQSVQNVENADSHAKALAEASRKVQEVVELISDISGQINLLALNATIESARAGEAGKGFAVVASEVKNLAGQTDKSIQEIEAVINEMGDVSNNIVNALATIKESVENIAQSSGGIASAVEEQSATTNEIADNMQSAAQGTQNINDNIQRVSTSAADSQTSSAQVYASAQDLSKQAKTLNDEVQSFLNEVRNG